MTKFIRTFCKISGLYSTHTVPLTQPFKILHVRHLYAPATLGIDGYLQSREQIKKHFSNMSEKFRTKMSEYAFDSDAKHMIFTEDLKNMLHLAENTNEDVSLVIAMLKKFNQQNKELRFGSYIFGPVVMRMFHFLNKPQEALECFTSKQLEGFFEQLMSYQLLLDLLYENGRYDDVLKTFDIIKSRQIEGTKYPRNIIVLTMAACYKMNTAESLEYALNLWKELNEVGHLPMRRAATFCAGLALKLGKPEVALEIISAVRKQTYMTVRNIKILALAEIGRIDDILLILKSVLDIDNPANKKHTFNKEIIQRAQIAVEKQENLSNKKEFQRVVKYLEENGHITDTTLDSQLCSEIEPPLSVLSGQKNSGQYHINTYRNKYQGSKTNNFRVHNQRPGLRDLQ